MRLIRRLIISLITLIGFLAIIIVSGYVYIRKTYNIDLFNTVNQLKILNKSITLDDLCSSSITSYDFEDTKNIVNKSVPNYITYEDGNGYNGYAINIDKIDYTMNKFMTLSNSQLGVIVQLVLYQKNGSKINISDKEVSMRLCQVEILNVQNDGSADMKMIVELDLTPLFDNMKKIPFVSFEKYAPKKLFVTSTIKIEKNEESFSYNVSHNDICINKLNSTDTTDFFNTLDFVFKIGNAMDLNLLIGKTIVDALIGTNDDPGFGYSLKRLGAKDFLFVILADTNFLIIQK